MLKAIYTTDTDLSSQRSFLSSMVFSGGRSIGYAADHLVGHGMYHDDSLAYFVMSEGMKGKRPNGLGLLGYAGLDLFFFSP